MPEGAVYVGRPTDYGNPFVGKTRADAVRTYREWLTRGSITVAVGPDQEIVRMEYIPMRNMPAEVVRMAKAYLRGKDLACWCPLDQPCHADVLLEIANA